jgi:replicative DNA helicase
MKTGFWLRNGKGKLAGATVYQDGNGNDLHVKAEIIIAKHRKGATGDVLLTFRGEFTRFENPEDSSLGPIPVGGEIIGSKIDGTNNPVPPSDEFDSFSGSPIPPPYDGPVPY